MIDRSKTLWIFASAYWTLTFLRMSFQGASVASGFTARNTAIVAGAGVAVMALCVCKRWRHGARASAVVIFSFLVCAALAAGDGRFLLIPQCGITFAVIAFITLRKELILFSCACMNIAAAGVLALFIPERSSIGPIEFSAALALSNLSIALLVCIVGHATRLMEQNEGVARKSARTDAAADAFAASISHEVRTPVNAIFGVNELFNETYETLSAEDIHKGVSVVQSAVADLSNLLANIRDATSLEQNALTLNAAPYCPARTLREVAARYEAHDAESPIAFREAIDIPDSVWLSGDKRRVRLLARNLLVCAEKSTREGAITFRAFINDEGAEPILHISVEAARAGEPDEAFGRLERAHEFGLGLALVHRLAARMGGRLTVSGERTGAATLTVSIPQGLSAPSAEEASARGAVVLVVSGNAINLRVLKGLLRALGSDADTVSSGDACVSRASTREYDIIFIDTSLTGMSAASTATAIRALGNEGTAVPLIAVSTRGEAEVGACFDAVLTKPVGRDELRKAIGRFVRSGVVA